MKALAACNQILERRRFSYCAIVAAALFFSPPFPVRAAEEKTPDAVKSAVSTPPAVIPLADIAARATEVANLLSSLTTAAAPGPAIENIAKALPDYSKKLDAEVETTKLDLQTEPALETLQALQQQWQRIQVDASAWLNTLTQQATKLQDGLNQLADLQKIWSSTRASTQAANAPGPIVEQIDATLKSIDAAQATLQTERAAVLDLQSRVAAEVTKSGAMLAQIGRNQQRAVAGIFVPDAEPVWRVDLWGDALQVLPEHVRKVRQARWADFSKYLSDPRQGIAFHCAIFIILALLFSAARRKVRQWKTSGMAPSSTLSVFERPYSAALAMALLFATSPFFQVSNAVRQILTIVVLVPMLRLAQPMTSPLVMPALYAVAALFAIETLRQGYGSIRVIGQLILVGETVAAIVALFSMRRRYQHLLEKRGESARVVLVKATRWLIIVGLVVSLLAGAAGYLRLARLMTPGILVGCVLALAAYAYLQVVGGLAALALRAWPVRLLKMVEQHRDQLERRVHRVLICMTVVGWTVRYLAYLGLLDNAWSLVEAVLATRFERGTISLSVGNILEFFLTVFTAYLLSRFLRFILEEDVYPRIDLAPGLSYAVSSLLNYIILALGFIAGLGVLGMDFSKVSVLAGALGVGIGFGLQSIVNNFVSGLILLFERPVHVGDTVEVGNLQGTVRRIGIRASVIHTGAGADIIVPNSQLVTDRVTNWTLSDRLRRVDLTVGVNYGAEPKKVIDLLEQVARAHPDVLPKPAPLALFMSYGDSSINFELRVWPKQFNLAAQVKSDLAAAVYDAVSAAGMSFPFPQREIRLLSDHEAGPTVLSGADKEKVRQS
jgi:potassium-dependent mechanosensitive channel